MSDLFGTARWSNAELAEVFGLSAQRLGVLCKQGVLPLPTDGLHEPKGAVAAYVRHLKQREEGKSQAGEAVRKLQLENEMRTLKLQRIAGELVPIERVRKDWFESTRRVRDGLLNLPNRLSGVFAAESNQEKIFELFNKEVHVVLTELASGHEISAAEARLPLDDTSELLPADETTDAPIEAQPAIDSLSPGPKEETSQDLDAAAERFSTGD